MVAIEPASATTNTILSPTSSIDSTASTISATAATTAAAANIITSSKEQLEQAAEEDEELKEKQLAEKQKESVEIAEKEGDKKIEIIQIKNIKHNFQAKTTATETTTTTSTTQKMSTPTSSTTPPPQITTTTTSTSSSKDSSCSSSSATATAAKETSKKAAVAAAIVKSAVSQRNVDIKIDKKKQTNKGDGTTSQELTKKVLKLDLTGKELDEYSMKSPKSPISARLPHQTSLTSSVDVEDRKTLREALYQGIFHRHRRTIFAVGSFLRMLRSRNSQYNTIRSSSEGEDVDEVR